MSAQHQHSLAGDTEAELVLPAGLILQHELTQAPLKQIPGLNLA